VSDRASALGSANGEGEFCASYRSQDRGSLAVYGTDSFGKVMCWKDRIDQLVQLIHWCGFGCLYVNDDLFCDLEDLDERKQVRRTT